MPQSLPILIVGAGPSGLVLALILAHNGVPFRFIEKQPHQPLGFRGSGLQPRNLELHHFLGTLREVEKLGRRDTLTRCYDLPPNQHSIIKDFAMVDGVDPTPDIPFIPGIKIDQSLQEEIFRNSLEQRFSKHVELSTALESFEQFDDHVVARLVKTDGTKETASFSYIVGSDGARGVTRKQLGIEFAGESPLGFMLTGDIRVTEGLDYQYWHTWGDARDKMVKLIHTGRENIFNFMVVDRALDPQSLLANRDEVVREIHRITGREDIKFGDATFVGVWKPNIRMVSEFSKGHVFLAGDSAHVHSPTGGQGMNSGEQDSLNLAWKLSLAWKGLASPSLLNSYSAERLPVITSMLSATSALFKQTIQGPKDKTDNINEKAWKRGGALFMLWVNYRGSSVLLDDRYPDSQVDTLQKNDFYDSRKDGRVCAGDRAPEAPELKVLGGKLKSDTQGVTSLFNGVFGLEHHSLLIYNSLEKDIGEVLEEVSAHPGANIRTVVIANSDESAPSLDSAVDLVVKDEKGYACKHYAVSPGDATIVIVRPDGVIGAVTTSGAQGVKKYFSKVLL